MSFRLAHETCARKAGVWQFLRQRSRIFLRFFILPGFWKWDIGNAMSFSCQQVPCTQTDRWSAHRVPLQAPRTHRSQLQVKFLGGQSSVSAGQASGPWVQMEPGGQRRAGPSPGEGQLATTPFLPESSPAARGRQGAQDPWSGYSAPSGQASPALGSYRLMLGNRNIRSPPLIVGSWTPGGGPGGARWRWCWLASPALGLWRSLPGPHGTPSSAWCPASSCTSGPSAPWGPRRTSGPSWW